jgi:cyclin-dependent kinase 8/11
MAAAAVQGKYQYVGQGTSCEICLMITEASGVIVGEGTFGVVYKARKHGDSNGRIFAIKEVRSQEEGDYKVQTTIQTLREIKLLKELKHPNVIFLEDVLISPRQNLSLVFDFADYELRQIIKYHGSVTKTPIPPPTLKSLMFQLLHGMHYLHGTWFCASLVARFHTLYTAIENWIIHRDLKPQNLLVVGTRDPLNRGLLKIAGILSVSLCSVFMVITLARFWTGQNLPISREGFV